MKKNVWKLLLIAILLLALALCCVACAGKPGADGKDGADGAVGAQGPQGEKGETGATGPQGPKGETGATGVAGPQGPTGPVGPQGPTGPAGEKGDDGVTPLIRINPDSNEWEVSTDNGSTWTTTNVQATGSVGPTGPQGASIEKVEFDAQGRLIITLTDDTVLDPIELPQKEEHQHTFGDWITLCEAACETKGAKMRICPCGASEAQEIPAIGTHDYTDWTETEPATCTKKGEETGVCSVCGETGTRAIEKTEHTSTSSLTCGVCGERVPYHRDGEYIYFGEYPQTIKSEGVTITETQDSRGYYLGSDGAYYAKVTADPYGSDYTFSDESAVADGMAYYFKVEPVLWRILSQSDNAALILCDSIIASKTFEDISGGYNNNYAESDIRSWLNEEFYSTAFTVSEQELILTTTVDNSAASTGYSSNPYTCENTNDKVFLLSRAEGMQISDSAKQVSDYSRATGAPMNTSSFDDFYYYGNGDWWLRSPSDSVSENAYFFDSFGVTCASSVYSLRGVVPALQIRLQ